MKEINQLLRKYEKTKDDLFQQLTEYCCKSGEASAKYVFKIIANARETSMQQAMQ